MIKCKVCNREFKSVHSIAIHLRNLHDLSQKEYYDKYLKSKNDGLCKICGKPTKFLSLSKGYKDCCCSACTLELHYGVRNVFQLESTKESIKKTMLDKYGVENASQSEEIKKKKIETCRKNYGIDYNLQRKETIAKTHSDEVIKKQSESRKKTLRRKYGVENSYLIDDVVKDAYEKKKSKSEQYFEDMLREFNIKFIAQFKDEYYPYFCDFYLPKYNCYIELNIFWSHQQCWFDVTDKNCKKKLKHLQDKINTTSGKSCAHYKKSLRTWTEVDLEKREMARKNDLNYKVFLDSRRSRRVF